MALSAAAASAGPGYQLQILSSVRLPPLCGATMTERMIPEEKVRALRQWAQMRVRDPRLLDMIDTVLSEVRPVGDGERYRRALERIADPEIFDADWRAMRETARTALSEDRPQESG